MSEPRLVHVVPHTHWDREWYFPFQRFRVALVDLVDQLLDLMERDEGYVFTLDGQLATVDDYLEIRPENEARLRALVESGRLAVGPWQILVDEFLVSGESIVRNLELGLRRAEELGGAMRIGYLPDMFGHVAQMPQLLRRAGLDRAVVWRGIPSAIDRHTFRWSAPDGSEVEAEYLVGGYGAAAYVFDERDGVEAALEHLVATLDPFFGDDDLLAMVGTDHKLPVPDLSDQIERVNAAQTELRLQLTTLGTYLDRPNGRGERPHWQGEMRSGARANLLMGVTSARIDLKAACARAERGLERYAEPLQALHGKGDVDAFLELAWRLVIDNSAHDSICGCSVDAVSAQVLVRYAEAEQVATELTRRAATAVAEHVPAGAFAVLNPSPESRADLVELELPVPADWDELALELPDGGLVAVQELSRREPLLAHDTIPGSEIGAWVARRLHGRELFGLWLNRVSVAGRQVTLEVADAAEPADVVALGDEIAAVTAAAPDEEWRIEIVASPRARVVARVPAPPLGWTSVRPVRGSAAGTVQTGPASLSNGLVELEVDEDGTFRLGDVRGIGRLVDGGDGGDSYNYAAPPADELVDEPESVSVALTAAGPVRGELTVVRAYRWPLGLASGNGSRADETALVPVTTRLELREGEPFVRVRVSFDNPAADHRLRFHVPLPVAAPSSFAEGQLGVVERGPVPEGGWGEVPLATYPARGFVDAGGMAVLLDHVTEYEVVEERELALTVLRSTGLISRAANPFRDDPAGPEIEMPAGQCRGAWSFGFALFPHAGSWVDADVAGWAERYQHPFVTAPGTGTGDALAEQAGLEVEGRGVVLSALRRREEWVELRLVCLQPEASTAAVRGRFGEAREANLLGEPGAKIALERGELRLDLGPWEIRTVQLRA